MTATKRAEYWRCGERLIDISGRPLVMGILNVTPDSFSDGGEHNRLEDAVVWARRMRDEGADMIDVGGESTRPGFSEVTLEEERRRVLPVVKALAAEGFLVSVDTSKPEIMTEAAALGAGILNDIRGFELPGALEAAAATNCGIVIMHSVKEPEGAKIADAVYDYLKRRTAAFAALGVSADRICWDPGYGFGKTPEENFELIAASGRYADSGHPLMVAVSRKSSLGRLTGRTDPKERVSASLSCAALACAMGARIARVHDAAETRDALLVVDAVRRAGERL